MLLPQLVRVQHTPGTGQIDGSCWCLVSQNPAGSRGEAQRHRPRTMSASGLVPLYLVPLVPCRDVPLHR